MDTFAEFFVDALCVAFIVCAAIGAGLLFLGRALRSPETQ